MHVEHMRHDHGNGLVTAGARRLPVSYRYTAAVTLALPRVKSGQLPSNDVDNDWCKKSRRLPVSLNTLPPVDSNQE